MLVNDCVPHPHEVITGPAMAGLTGPTPTALYCVRSCTIGTLAKGDDMRAVSPVLKVLEHIHSASIVQL